MVSKPIDVNNEVKLFKVVLLQMRPVNIEDRGIRWGLKRKLDNLYLPAAPYANRYETKTLPLGTKSPNRGIESKFYHRERTLYNYPKQRTAEHIIVCEKWKITTNIQQYWTKYRCSPDQRVAHLLAVIVTVSEHILFLLFHARKYPPYPPPNIPSSWPCGIPNWLFDPPRENFYKQL